MNVEHLLTRRRPARELSSAPRQSAFIFITACTKERRPLLNNGIAHQTLRKAWLDYRDWLVGPYVLMPDHLHMIVAPTNNHPAPLRRWITWWKRLTSQALRFKEDELWQRDIWDYRLRSRDNFAEIANYIFNNPVRAGLVQRSDEWSYAGRIHRIGG